MMLTGSRCHPSVLLFEHFLLYEVPFRVAKQKNNMLRNSIDLYNYSVPELLEIGQLVEPKLPAGLERVCFLECSQVGPAY